MTGMPRRLAMLLVCLAGALFAPLASANRVALDRDRIGQSETVNLTIDLDDARRSDLSALGGLKRDFAVVGQSMSRQEDAFSGRVWLSMQLTLQPLRAGTILISTAEITGEDSAPLRLEVTPARDATPTLDPALAGSRQPAFVMASLDTATPYVQQSVGYTLRMYFDDAVIPEGELAVPPPAGASLIRTGDERMLTARSGNRTYRVVERHYLLVPERSGALQIPGAAFVGRITSPFDTGIADQVRIPGPALALQVRPLPANAPQPWLPLRAATLRYRVAPKALREGEAATVELEFTATGATAASLPALSLSAGDGAQVIPDRADAQDAFVDGAPQATVKRRFSIVPVRDGTLRIVAPRIVWWDTAAGRARVASLPDLVLPVAPAPPGRTPRAAAGGGAPAAGGLRAWLDASAWRWWLVGLPLVWLTMAATLWAIRLHRRRRASAPVAAAPPVAPAPVARAPSPAVPPPVHAPPPAPPAMPALVAALAQGDLVAIESALIRAAPRPAQDLDAVRGQLDAASQRAALDALQLARWGGGDADAARAALRAAFADGPRWRASPRTSRDDLLPPLYPGG